MIQPAMTSPYIDEMADQFQMLRPDAVMDAAQVIPFEAFCGLPSKKMMGQLNAEGLNRKGAISFGGTLAQPHGATIQAAFVYFNLYVSPPSQTVACHELGHALGLGHQAYGAGSCMANDSMFPNVIDYGELESLYR